MMLDLNILINEDQTIRTALEKINRSGLKTIIVIDKKNKFKGIISNGDVRRAILKKIRLNDSVKKIYNRSSTFLFDKDYNEKNQENFL